MELTGAAANATTVMIVGLLNIPTPLFAGTLVPVDMLIVTPMATDGAGTASIGPINGGHPASPTLYFQMVTVDFLVPQFFDFSNALEVQYLP